MKVGQKVVLVIIAIIIAIVCIRGFYLYHMERVASKPQFGATNEPYEPYLKALRGVPENRKPTSSDWEVAYVGAAGYLYIDYGYLHLGVTTQDGKQLNLIVKRVEYEGLDKGVLQQELKDLSYRCSFFTLGTPIIVFPTDPNTDGYYTTEDIRLIGFFRAEIEFDEQEKPQLTDVEYIFLR